MFLQLKKCFVDQRLTFFCLSVVGSFVQYSGNMSKDMQWIDITSKVQAELKSDCWGATTFSLKELLLMRRCRPFCKNLFHFCMSLSSQACLNV